MKSTRYTSFNDRYIPVTESGCWIWIAEQDRNGYGIFTKKQGSKKLWKKFAHRYVWEQSVGPIPEGMCLLHRCDVPSCVNPKHMFIGTHADNVKDKVAKRRHGYGEKHYMHKLTEDEAKEIIASPLSANELVKTHKYPVTRGAINAIKTGYSWRYLPRGGVA